MKERNLIFISHANPEDNIFVTWLGAKLSAMGYEVWADVLDLVGGQDWQRKLEDSLRKRAVKVLLVGTQLGVNKQGVRNEIQIASNISKEIQDSEFIIPLKLEDFDAPFLIAHAQHIDFSNSWAKGLKELTETLLKYKIPTAIATSLKLWESVQLFNGKNIIPVQENLISNWLKFSSLPNKVHFYDFRAGISIDYKDSALMNSKIPLVSKNRGFISFADPESLKSELGNDLPFDLIDSCDLESFLEGGWPKLKIDLRDARNHISNMLRQGIEEVFLKRSLSKYEMSNKKISWFGAKNSIPQKQMSFSWSNGVSGRRVVMGYSEKRNLYWHYGFSPQISMWPEPHIKLRGNLIFSEDGLTPINDSKRMHRLRRSFAKSWRNARWRDMMLAFLWWVADEEEFLIIPFGEKESAILEVPTIIFVSPVSISNASEEADPNDKDDPEELEDLPSDFDVDDIVEEVSA